jgi:hypothetical protein
MGKHERLWPVLIVSLAIFAGCRSTQLEWPRLDCGHPAGITDAVKAMSLTEVTTDRTYGYTQNNPIKVGGGLGGNGSRNQRQYLAALAGPNGEPITFERLGSCCPYSSPEGLMGQGMLDQYVVAHDGIEKPVILYLTFYDEEEPKAPYGFSIAR